MVRFASPRVLHSSSSRRLVFVVRSLLRPSAIIGTLFLATVVASGVATRSMVTPLPVFAACQAANGSCGLDLTKTAVVDVAYFIPGGSSVTPIEPTAATTIQIDAYFGRPSGNCTDIIETGYVDVSWNGSNWAASNFNGTTDILAAAVCTLSSCTGFSTHSSSYRLYVDINDPDQSGNFSNLRQIEFTATTVPNGTDFNSVSCASGTSHSPTASTFSATDGGSFECGYNCSATGATMNVTYN